MRENFTSGSVWGEPGNRLSYHDYPLGELQSSMLFEAYSLIWKGTIFEVEIPVRFRVGKSHFIKCLLPTCGVRS